MNFYDDPNLQERKGKRFDNFFAGFIPSVIIPLVLIILISSGGKFSSFSLEELFMKAYHNYMFVKITILALIPNLFIFFFFYKTERWKASSGLIVATLLFLILLVLKF